MLLIILIGILDIIVLASLYALARHDQDTQTA